MVVRAVLAGRPSVVDDGLSYLRGHAWFDPFGITRKAFAAANPSAVLLGTDGLVAGGRAREDAVVAFVADVAEQLREAREAGELSEAEEAPEAAEAAEAGRAGGQRRPVSSQASWPPSSSPQSVAAG